MIVESPAKASTIKRYLGKGWEILATFGHIRDLPSKSDSVEPANDFLMYYQISIKSKRHVDAISKFIIDNKSSVEIFLATDPDREGEAISWHLIECLKLNSKVDFKKLKIKRIVFNAITKDAVIKAVDKPRNLDDDLVNAQQARLALDYLVGFTISPILWKTVGGIRSSAGRVQSVALRILADRELEILDFHAQEYWTIHGDFKIKNINILANLILFDGKKIEKLTISNDEMATNILNIIKNNKIFLIKDIEKKQQQRNPYPPFTTSSLQQEASKRLGFNSKKTMRIAQKLYEGVNVNGENVGLITYMRTDGIFVTSEAIEASRNFIKTKFGEKYLPNLSRIYKNKIKNAQEAHEAIRPTTISYDFSPEKLKNFLSSEELALYQLIWKRMIASQMSSAAYDITNILITNNDDKIVFKSTFSNLIFDGFLAAYEYQDDEELETRKIDLSKISVSDTVDLKEVIKKQHFTEPPARYTEAGLIKKMEEIGIGRPSTYATIISILQLREYAKLVQKRFSVTIKGHVIVKFLINFFPKYFAFDFTANMENELDEVASGEINWKALLKKFWSGFSENTQDVLKTEVSEIMNKVSEAMSMYLFQADNDEQDRQCPLCLENNRENGKLNLKYSKFGYFLGCSNYPECAFSKSIGENLENSISLSDKLAGKIEYLYQNDTTKVRLKTGRYGDYLEIEKDDIKKNLGISKEVLKSLTPEYIEQLINLPIHLGNYNGSEITVNIGKFGFYIAHNKLFAPLGKKFDPFKITLDEALELLKVQEEKNIKNTKIFNSKKFGDINIKRGGFGKTYLIYKDKKFVLPSDLSFANVELEGLEKFLTNKKIKLTK